MALTRKHFRALANILAEHRRNLANPSRERSQAYAELEDDVCRFCRSHNASFDVDRFRAAAWKEGE